MKIHLITNLFHPDELAGASLFTDLALYLARQQHDIRVTTTFPYYPAWQLRPEDQGIALRSESFHGIEVRRVSMYVPRQPDGKKRVLSDLSFLWALLRHGSFPGWDPDVVLTASPMFSQCLAQRFLYLGKKIPRLIVVQDFVVDAALELGILKLPVLSTLLNRLERWSFESAQTLFTISEAMLEKLRDKLGSESRCELVPNWIHASLEDEIQQQALQDAPREPLTLFYSGNLGVKQGLPNFIRAFKECGADWRLLVHGGGAELANLTAEVAGTDSITLGGVLDTPAYVQKLRSVTACLITQKSGIGANFLPSKLLPALATGTPVLAVCDASSPLGIEVREGGFGEVIEPDDRAGLLSTLTRWQKSPGLLLELGQKSKLRSKLYSRETILPKYEAALASLVQSNAIAS